jgi:cytochrome b subunit of formate dehydrogenase
MKDLIINKLRYFLYCVFCCVKFITGWIMWITIFLLSLLFSTITWNWKETVSLDMENVITEICGKSTWNCMMLNTVFL